MATKKKTVRKRPVTSSSNTGKTIFIVAMAVIAIVAIVIAAVFFGRKSGGDSDATTATDESGNILVPSTTAVEDVQAENYSFVINDTSVFVRRDGTILSADVDSFTEEYYDKDEFEKEWLVPEVQEYNNDKYKVPEAYAADGVRLGAAINSLTLTGSALVLQMDYATPEDYLAFNKQVNMYFSNWNTFTVCELNAIDSSLKLFDASGNPVDVAELKNSGRTYHVAVIGFGGTLPTGFSGRFQFEGKVMATSEGISFTSDNGVRLYDSGNLQYVVFW